MSYRLSPLLPDGGFAFTSHVDVHLGPTSAGTDLTMRYRIADSTVDSVDFVAEIERGVSRALIPLRLSSPRP